MVYDRRTELGLTQGELAERAGMSQPQLSRLE
ncbi:helix-turn-helix domain-containing protein [Dactylosporangium vinaceum]|uniref:Helix-turn-helix domain-containing protein n=1 Tax=Dactylosporangium vinaceum TaxID=53362 RepID=A0ABV5MQE5_9ACTN|nr:helix-turn-helix domain-containing protein [Dactylosporangium vinaceum]